MRATRKNSVTPKPAAGRGNVGADLSVSTETLSMPELAARERQALAAHPALSRRQQAQELEQMAREIRAALPELGVYEMGIMRAALDVVRSANSCGVTAPLEALIAELLILQSGGRSPGLEEIEYTFENFRANFEGYINTARSALRLYPDLVKPDAQGIGKSRALEILAGGEA